MNKEQELELILHKTLDTMLEMTSTLLTVLSQSAFIIKSADDIDSPLTYKYIAAQEIGSGVTRKTTMLFELGENGILKLISTDVEDS